MKAFLCFILKPYMFSMFSLFHNFFLFWFSRNIGLFSRKPAIGSLPCTDSDMYFSFLFKFSFWNLFAQLIQFITLLTHYYSQLYSHHLQGFWFEFVVDSNPICKSKENANCLMNYISFLFFFHNLILYNVPFSGLIRGQIYSMITQICICIV